MKKTVLVVSCFILLTSLAFGQKVTITGFPLGVGGSIGDSIFDAQRVELKAMADTLHKYPLSHVLITGSADAERYRASNDAMNPALALSRTHALRNYLIAQFGVDTAQIFSRTEEVYTKGPEFRYVRAEVNRDLSDLSVRLARLENAPPPEPVVQPVKEIVTIREVPADTATEVKLHLGAGLMTSPFGGIPIASAAVSWDEHLFLEAVIGHTFWNSDYDFSGLQLNTKRRLIGGQAVYYPSETTPIGIVGGWMRIEDVSRDFYKYVRLSEGIMVGLRWLPTDFLSLTGVYNPSKHQITDIAQSETKNGQFLFSAAFHIDFGGAK
ncbi:MAG: hypothetical protein P1R58_04100 [bacterium]|nr:hypothetical protein [bacterium]